MFGAGSVIFIMLEVKLVNIRWPGGRRRVGNEQVPTALVGANAALHARFHTGSLPHLNRHPVASESRSLSILRVLGCQMVRWHHALLNLVRDRSPGCIGKTRQSFSVYKPTQTVLSAMPAEDITVASIPAAPVEIGPQASPSR